MQLSLGAWKLQKKMISFTAIGQALICIDHSYWHIHVKEGKCIENYAELSSGVARALPSGRDAHLEDQNEEEN